MLNLKDILIQKSQELGFEKIGFASTDEVNPRGDYLKSWIADGKNAEMKWFEKRVENRISPALALPGAKTVIILAYSYFSGEKHPENLDPSKYGKVSRYAWGLDYHDVILPKLKLIAEEINKYFPESEAKTYVDTGPVMEKFWAEKSGIGWQGKNCLILSKELGSWVFLGSIITTAEIETDQKAENYCGDCTECLDACPTGALFEPYKLDARKCISYWTDSAKPNNEIPEEIAENLEGWAYGCDICQNVCPWNAKVKPKTNNEIYNTELNKVINFEEIERMTNSEFKEKFNHRAVKFIKLGGMKRNIRALRRPKK